MGLAIYACCKQKSFNCWLFTIVTFFILQGMFEITAAVFFNEMADHHVSKKYFLIAYSAPETLYYCCYLLGHWIFAFRYWPVAIVIKNMRQVNRRTTLILRMILCANCLLIVGYCIVFGFVYGQKFPIAVSIGGVFFIFVDIFVVALSLYKIGRRLP